MKNLKYILTSILVVFIVFACVNEDDNLDNVNAIAAPTNVSALVTVTQDNTGLVTITPLGEGVVSFRVNYGDGSELSEELNPGQSTQHTYEEGVYNAIIVATGLNGKTTSVNQEVVVSFQAPQNLVVTIENDPTISKQVNIFAEADFALSYEVDFGDGSEAIMTNFEDVYNYQYTDAGVYTITVTAFSAATDTTIYTEDFEVTAILQPLTAAPAQPARAEADVISIYSGYYTDVAGTDYNPNWGQSTTYTEVDINGDPTIQYGNLNYQGIQYGATVDASAMEYLHIDVWTADAPSLEIYPISIATGEQQVTVNLVADQWNSFDIPISDFTSQGLSMDDIHQFKFVGSGTVFIDNLYYYKSPSAQNTLVGTWKMSEQAGALGVGPAVGDISWWNCDDACVATRACYYDDTYVFNPDGSFSNVLGADTWVEGWQGGSDACGAPVAPHDGSAMATYNYDAAAGTVTINGAGAYIGLAKANNQGELPNVALPNAITYNVSFIDANTINVYVESGAGVFWQYRLERVGATASPLEGTWKMSEDAGSLGVGPAVGDTSWWNCDAACVTTRACFYDDTYVFNPDGSFQNVLGTDTWVEGWQGGSDACGTPVAPYDGSAMATYNYDAAAGTLTINGTGAFVGIPKANNQGELPNVAVPSSITYNISFIDSNTISVYVESGAGVFWQYKLVKI
ncbi:MULTISPECIES: hypothetical protein [Mesoflavibacter]|uniref:PKD domain-containing protein n=1 Tax=Mesoflavibacter profundi TaxID=2708110 RepID=A0ABT4RX49_9FLAO|nr:MULTISPECIES: hypothetical protein [Mesoflavibacter]MDA0176327.1 hypothetical protein [Mesoflavibacter profundi]QIJ89967.1 hypothetical protein C7H62_2159 [Mesoflavibacter sp. HG96]QIJ92695.1 hypothetical protein C7H56_2159 [Mesoflavibacter sp. HG37]